jgi:hypothetical protein
MGAITAMIASHPLTLPPAPQAAINPDHVPGAYESVSKLEFDL